MADEPKPGPTPARDVAPGSSWAFRDHRTMQQLAQGGGMIQLDLLDRATLAYDPFSGDDTDYKTLRDKMVIARKSGPCHICQETIQPRQRVRALAQVFDGTAATFRFCPVCCDAMAKADDDNGEAIALRHALGMKFGS